MFATETKTFLPKSASSLSLDLRCAKSTGFYGKLFPRSGILKEHFVTIDAGVIDADFRGVIQVLIMNHHPEKSFTVRTEDRIALVVFIKKLNAKFHRLSDQHLLGKTKCGNDGFGSTGVHVIKKTKQEDEIQSTTSEEERVTVNSEEDFQMVPEKSEEDLQITSEKAVMTVNNEVVVHESITIDE